MVTIDVPMLGAMVWFWVALGIIVAWMVIKWIIGILP